MGKNHVSESSEQLIQQVCQFLGKASESAISDHGYFSIGLSGGSSASIVSKALTSESVCQQVNWGKWHIFFCDERYVPLADPDSNYNAFKAQLFDRVPIPEKQIYSIDSNIPLKDSAMDYEAKIKSLFGNVEFPKFDVLVLGMGQDGHICSLFPNHTLLDEASKWIGSIEESPKPPPKRITMTLPILNNAKAACFTVTGASKAEMVREAVINPNNKSVPASLVDPNKVDVHWFLDKDSAKFLN